MHSVIIALESITCMTIEHNHCSYCLPYLIYIQFQIYMHGRLEEAIDGQLAVYSDNQSGKIVQKVWHLSDWVETWKMRSQVHVTISTTSSLACRRPAVSVICWNYLVIKLTLSSYHWLESWNWNSWRILGTRPVNLRQHDSGTYLKG